MATDELPPVHHSPLVPHTERTPLLRGISCQSTVRLFHQKLLSLTLWFLVVRAIHLLVVLSCVNTSDLSWVQTIPAGRF